MTAGTMQFIRDLAQIEGAVAHQGRFTRIIQETYLISSLRAVLALTAAILGDSICGDGQVELFEV
jgi:hypothetical protein